MHFEPMHRLLLGVLLWGGRGRALRRNTRSFVSSRHIVVVRSNHVCFGNNDIANNGIDEISTDTNRHQVSDRDSFLFGNDMSTFSHCGVTSNLATALIACGKQHATTIQAKSFTAISRGQDVVIGSETGSGKTLAYLVPIIHQLLEADDYEEVRVFPHAVIMCPNKELAAQVYRMASELMTQLSLLGKTNIRTGLFNQQLQYWPRFNENDPSPSIAVCTPAFLAHFIKGPNIQEVDLFRNVRHLVLDEADMLLEGSYLKDVEKIIDTFRLVRREMIHDGVININDKVLQTVLVAATLPTFGLRSIDQYIAKRFPTATRITNDYLHKHHPRIQQQFVETSEDVLSSSRVGLVANAIRGNDGDRVTDMHSQELSVSLLASQEIDIHSQLVQTMVFVNTAEVAQQLAHELEELGILTSQYHNLVMDKEKQDNLRRFRDNEVSVLVCTDHAARGLDLPRVRHVIQAEFALNVVQHLHRVGRASRAGVLGKATNFYDDRSKDLVNSILSDTSGQNNVENSFSRRRGFRSKIKKQVKRDLL